MAFAKPFFPQPVHVRTKCLPLPLFGACIARFCSAKVISFLAIFGANDRAFPVINAALLLFCFNALGIIEIAGGNYTERS